MWKITWVRFQDPILEILSTRVKIFCPGEAYLKIGRQYGGVKTNSIGT